MSSLMAYILKLSDQFLLIKFSLCLGPGHSMVNAACVPASLPGDQEGPVCPSPLL